MNELIALTQSAINGELQQTVNARELHAFLEVQTRFNDWIAARINEYGFVENQEFVSFTENPVKPQGGRPSKEYQISLDMAKELAMVERNEKGKQARQYFIGCEKKLRETVQPQPARVIGATEDKLNTIILALQHTSLSDVAKETYIITSAETLTGVCIGYRPKVEQVTYSAKEIGDMLGISANRIGRIANAHGLKTEEYGSYYLNKSQHSDKQVEHFRYFENAIEKFKAILGDD